MSKRIKGKVKFFDPKKGFGFIAPQGGGEDIFVHISALRSAGLETLEADALVEYEEGENRGRVCAKNVRIV